MQTVLLDGAEAAARDSGFRERESKLGGAVFAQALVFGCLDNPLPTLDDFAQAAAGAGCSATPQAFQGRFTPEAADFLRRVLACAVAKVIAAPEPSTLGLLARFSAVSIQDSSKVVLPDCLAELWRGNGGSTDDGTASAVKLQVRLDLRQGQLTGPFLEHGRASDQRCVLQTDELPRGSVRITDQGYFDLDEFVRLDGIGVYFLSRLLTVTAVFDEAGRRLDLLSWLRRRQSDVTDVAVRLGVERRLKARLIAIKVPRKVYRQRRKRLLADSKKRGKAVSEERLQLCRWTLLVTTIPQALASTAEVVVLARLRWQIELLFKVWKSDVGLGRSNSQKAYRVLCEVYAKLIAALVQHWLVLVGGWPQAKGRSYRKAAKAARKVAVSLCAALRDRAMLEWQIHVTVLCQSAGTKSHKSRKDPRAYQLAEEPTIFGLTP
jgi:hypothetical protein